MGKIIIFVGTPGAGKSTVLNKVKSGAKFNIGTEMFSIAKQKYKRVATRDDIRKEFTPSEIKELRKEALHKIMKVAEKENVIVDTHASVRSGNVFVPGFVLSELDAIKEKLAAIIYIDAEANDILGRRKKDKSRRRDIDTEADLEDQRHINLSYSCTYSAYVGIPLYIINNGNGRLGEAINKAKKSVKEIFA